MVIARLRVPNIMKHVCVAARIGDGKTPGEGNSRSIAKTSNEASADSGCNPYGLARVLACSPRLSAKGFWSWGGDGGRAAQVHSGAYGTVPANGPAANESRRRIVKSPLLRMTKPQAFLLALSQNRDSASRVSLCYRLLFLRRATDDFSQLRSSHGRRPEQNPTTVSPDIPRTLAHPSRNSLHTRPASLRRGRRISPRRSRRWPRLLQRRSGRRRRRILAEFRFCRAVAAFVGVCLFVEMRHR